MECEPDGQRGSGPQAQLGPIRVGEAACSATRFALITGLQIGRETTTASVMPKQREEQNDRDRDPKKPKQNSAPEILLRVEIGNL